MHIHILGICGTFMAGVATLAKQQGHRVTGSDVQFYPPMNTQLAAEGIECFEGYDPAHLQPAPDLIIVGNALSRGNPAIEYLLDQQIPYISGPQWLAENVLKNRWVLAVSGTHGKTTTSSLLAWILEGVGLNPGFLIGGIPENFGVSARLTDSPYFVVEADEYDSAFFDKRSKFLHYRPKTLILNNLEFDHADIFPDLEAIKRQFHYLVRTVPHKGLLVCPKNDTHLADVLTRGCWTPVEDFGISQGQWHAKDRARDGSSFSIYHQEQCLGNVNWSLLGQHNICNALAALAAAHHAGVDSKKALQALSTFHNVKRRLEVRGVINNITIYDDFAHHPTAIETTIAGLRGKVGKAKIIAVLECGSYTMRTGVHKDHLAKALKEADQVFFAKPKGLDWGISQVASELTVSSGIYEHVEALISDLVKSVRTGDHVLIMSNTGFEGIHEKLIKALTITPIQA